MLVAVCVELMVWFAEVYAVTVPVLFTAGIVFSFPSGKSNTFPNPPPAFTGFIELNTVIFDKSKVFPELETSFAELPVLKVTFSRTNNR